MTWSYKDPGKNNKDATRFRIADTDIKDQLLSDEEINWVLARNSEDEGSLIDNSVLECAREILKRLSLEIDEKVGAVDYKNSQRFTQYTDMVERLERDMGASALPYCGGISISQKETVEEDTDRVKPAFTRDLMEDTEIDQDDETRGDC